MKKILLLFIPAMMLGISSCEKTKVDSGEKGRVEFVMSTAGSGLKAAVSDSVTPGTYQLLLTIADMNGVPVLEDKLLPVFLFGNDFVSEKIEIGTGRLQLLKFMVISPDGSVIYAAPLEGSPRSYLVNDPLPLRFAVSAGEVTTLHPEVLSVNGASPSEFGYVSFGINIVNPVPVYVLAMLDNPLVMAPTQITTATLVVTSADGWQHKFFLEAKINKIEIRGGSGEYTFEVLKDGYAPAKFRFSERELRATSEQDPLVLKIGGDAASIGNPEARTRQRKGRTDLRSRTG